jgi:hypothetical protein
MQAASTAMPSFEPTEAHQQAEQTPADAAAQAVSHVIPDAPVEAPKAPEPDTAIEPAAVVEPEVVEPTVVPTPEAIDPVAIDNGEIVPTENVEAAPVAATGVEPVATTPVEIDAVPASGPGPSPDSVPRTAGLFDAMPQAAEPETTEPRAADQPPQDEDQERRA